MVARSVDTRARVFAVSRFSDERAAAQLERAGCRIVQADLSDPACYAGLPDAPNVIFMAGRKFGTSDGPALTWQTNVVVPALVAARYRASRLVAFSSGNVYPQTVVASGGSRETDALGPVGEYAWSCVGRERVFAQASASYGTPVALLRLNYAVDLRYGVLVDVAWQVKLGEPIDLATGHVNCIWQGDANAIAIAALAHASAPPFILNVTGPDTISIRAVAEEFGRRFGRPPRLVGSESDTALLSDAAWMQRRFGPPRVSTALLVDWVADWVARGGERLGKPTHYGQRAGSF
jgi:nucleoside-diphosphate-sugar epimerase